MLNYVEHIDLTYTPHSPNIQPHIHPTSILHPPHNHPTSTLDHSNIHSAYTLPTPHIDPGQENN